MSCVTVAHIIYGPYTTEKPLLNIQKQLYFTQISSTLVTVVCVMISAKFFDRLRVSDIYKALLLCSGFQNGLSEDSRLDLSHHKTA